MSFAPDKWRHRGQHSKAGTPLDVTILPHFVGLFAITSSALVWYAILRVVFRLV